MCTILPGKARDSAQSVARTVQEEPRNEAQRVVVAKGVPLLFNVDVPLLLVVVVASSYQTGLE